MSRGVQEHDLSYPTYPTRAQRRWQERHPRACPQCGSHDGMYKRALAIMTKVPADIEWYRREGRDDGRNDAIYTPCPHCTTDLEGYTHISHEKARAMWQMAIKMDYQELARTAEIEDRLGSIF